MSEHYDDGAGWRLNVVGEWRWFAPKPFTWVDTDAEYARQMERIEREVAANLEAERQRQLAADEAKALALMKASNPVPGYQALGDVLQRKHLFTAEWRTHMPAAAAAFAEIAKRNVVCPPIVDAETFAVFLHETGHILSERCRGGLHQPDPRVRDWWHCIRCETLAWERAMTLAPFSYEMFSRLRSSLASYRRSTPAPAAALAELDRLRSPVTYQRTTVARWHLELNDERRRLVAKWLREAGR